MATREGSGAVALVVGATEKTDGVAVAGVGATLWVTLRLRLCVTEGLVLAPAVTVVPAGCDMAATSFEDPLTFRTRVPARR